MGAVSLKLTGLRFELSVARFRGGEERAAALVQAAPVPCGRYPPGGLALFPLHPQLSRRGGDARPARHRRQLRDDPVLDHQVRTADRPEPEAQAAGTRGLARCSARGLRKSAATRLADAGCSEPQITAVTGHATWNEVRRHTAVRDQRRLAASALGSIGGTEAEQDLANPDARQAKPTS